ncbi:MAG: peptidoglycan bridge formation glycyltransferase FemA/FemB family protein [Thermoplasmata archaeon]|nr:peptidoglycan bridge formation glycyltransferase FemA/FemB family protein [Thermoplasmata archaeon]
MAEITSFKVTTNLDTKKWQSFVEQHPKGNIFQTPEMAKVWKSTKKYEPIFLSIINEKTEDVIALISGYIVKEMAGPLGSFSSRSIVFGGPLFLETELEVEAVKLLIKEYDKLAKKKALYTQIRMLEEVPLLSDPLKIEGYEFEEHLNFLIDLTQGEEQLWKNLNKKRRNSIRKAIKSNVDVEELSKSREISIAYEFLKETYTHAKLPLADISFFQSIYDILVKKDMAKIFLAKYEDKYIAVIVTFMYKDIIYDLYAGATREFLSVYPNDILPWHVMVWGSKNNFHTFDFGGAGKPNEEYGVRDFKKKYGGKLVNFGRYEKVHSPKKLKVSKQVFKLVRKFY